MKGGRTRRKPGWDHEGRTGTHDTKDKDSWTLILEKGSTVSKGKDTQSGRDSFCLGSKGILYRETRDQGKGGFP